MGIHREKKTTTSNCHQFWG